MANTYSTGGTRYSGLLTVPDLALASNESQAAWRKRIFLRQISFVRCGRNVRVSQDAFAQWLRDRTTPAKPNAEQLVGGIQELTDRSAVSHARPNCLHTRQKQFSRDEAAQSDPPGHGPARAEEGARDDK